MKHTLLLACVVIGLAFGCFVINGKNTDLKHEADELRARLAWLDGYRTGLEIMQGSRSGALTADQAVKCFTNAEEKYFSTGFWGK